MHTVALLLAALAVPAVYAQGDTSTRTSFSVPSSVTVSLPPVSLSTTTVPTASLPSVSIPSASSRPSLSSITSFTTIPISAPSSRASSLSSGLSSLSSAISSLSSVLSSATSGSSSVTGSGTSSTSATSSQTSNAARAGKMDFGVGMGGTVGVGLAFVGVALGGVLVL